MGSWLCPVCCCCCCLIIVVHNSWHIRVHMITPREAFIAGARGSREGWPLLTVETEVNGDSKRVQMKGVLSWLVGLGAGTRFCSPFDALVGPIARYNFFLLTIHYFSSFVPIVQQARQAAVLGRLSLSMCLWLAHTGSESANHCMQTSCA